MSGAYDDRENSITALKKLCAQGLKARELALRQGLCESQGDDNRLRNIRDYRPLKKNVIEVWNALLHRTRSVKEEL
jgi:hypothetical protein